MHTLLGFTKTLYATGSNTTDERVSISGIDKIHSKFDCVDGGIANGTRQPFLIVFTITSGYETNKKP